MSDTEGTQLGSLHPCMLHPHAVLCVREYRHRKPCIQGFPSRGQPGTDGGLEAIKKHRLHKVKASPPLLSDSASSSAQWGWRIIRPRGVECEVHETRRRQHAGCRETDCLQTCFVSSLSIKTNLGRSSKMNRFHSLLRMLISLGELEDLAMGTFDQLLTRDSDIVNCTPYICQGWHHSPTHPTHSWAPVPIWFRWLALKS